MYTRDNRIYELRTIFSTTNLNEKNNTIRSAVGEKKNEK